MGLILLSIFIGFLFLIYNFFRNRQYYWENRNVPHIKGQFFYGNAKGVGKTIPQGDFFRDIYFEAKKIGPCVGFNLYFVPMIMLTDPELMKIIMIKDFNTFPNRGMYHNEEDDPASANLAAIEGEKWKRMRNKLTPTLSSGKIKIMTPILVEVADKMIERIAIESEQFGALAVKEINSRFTIDVIGRVSFGIECNSLDDKSTKFYEMGIKAFENQNFFKRQLTRIYPDLARKLHITTSNFEVVNFYRDIVQQTIKYREENNIERNDVLQLLMKLMKESNDPLTFNEVWTSSMAFFLGGYETTATTLSFCLYELSQRKDIQEKAREKIKQALSKHNGEFTYESVGEMHYIEQCINESLRKHPTAVATRRIPQHDYRVPNSDIVIEKGTTVMIPIQGLNYDPEIYPNPYEFDPDRFSPEEVAKRHNFTFLPFGEGPRNCIGERLAIIEAKIALAKIILNYELELDRSKTPVPLKYMMNAVTLTPTDTIYVNFKKI